MGNRESGIGACGIVGIDGAADLSIVNVHVNVNVNVCKVRRILVRVDREAANLDTQSRFLVFRNRMLSTNEGWIGVRWVVVLLCGGLVAVSGCGGCDDGGGASSEERAPQTERETSADDEGSGKADTSEGGTDEVERRNIFGEGSQESDQDDGAGASCSFFPDSCPDGQTCVVTDAGEKRCAAPGSGAEGDECARANGCQSGLVCVGDGPARCRSVCRPNREDCPPGLSCVPLDVGGDARQLGACQPPDDQCTLWPDDSCDLGEQCIVTPAGRACRSTSPNAELGAPCPEGPTDCQYGQTCVTSSDGQRRCRAKCTRRAEPCAQGRCVQLDNRPFGYCPEGGRR